MATDDRTANFELEEDGGNMVWTSEGEQSLTFGYAGLNCAEPVAAQVLYSSSVADKLVTLTSMSSTRKADRFLFTLIPQIGSLALIIANDLDPDANCEAELESPYGSVLGKASISVPAETSVFQMVDELFRIPEDYTAGAVRVLCDRKLAATGFMLNGGAYSVLPPAVLSMPMIGISGGETAMEGGDVVFTITANAPTGKDLALSLFVSDIGSHLDVGDLGEKQVVLPAGRTSVDYFVATIDDENDEVDGTVTVTIIQAEGYVVSEIDDSALVAIRDNDKPLPAPETPVTLPPITLPPGSQPPATQPPGSQPPATPLDPGICRVGLQLNSENTSCTHETPFFTFTISNSFNDGVWRGIFSGSRQAGFSPGPARLEVADFVAERASDNETWTILKCACR